LTVIVNIEFVGGQINEICHDVPCISVGVIVLDLCDKPDSVTNCDKFRKSIEYSELVVLQIAITEPIAVS
jgi:hypothetical protein